MMLVRRYMVRPLPWAWSPRNMRPFLKQQSTRTEAKPHAQEDTKTSKEDPSSSSSFATHPGVVVTGLATLLGLYLYHNRERNLAKKAIIEGLDSKCPIAPSEIRTLRESNRIKEPEFRQFIQDCKEHFPEGKATFLQFAWLAHKHLGEDPPSAQGHRQQKAVTAFERKIKNHHILERVAVTMQQRYENAKQEKLKQKETDTGNESENETVSTRAFPNVNVESAGSNPQPLSVKELLVYYNVLVDEDVDTCLNVITDMVKESDSVPAFQYDLVEDIVEAELGDAKPKKRSDTTEDYKRKPQGVQLTHDEMIKTIELLRNCWQIPLKTRTVEVKAYPRPISQERTAEDHLKQAMVFAKVKREEVEDRGGFTQEEVHDIVFSSAICAWGECEAMRASSR